MSHILAIVFLLNFTVLAFANSLDVDAHKQALREANVIFNHEFERCDVLYFEDKARRNACRGTAKAKHTKAVEKADADRAKVTKK